ncbi:MAG: hypothetical protein RR842_08770 [Gordonibacter sp.]|uniref:Mu transposase domain-containing protein n=1 Tax=Gordonibacter sp. TaxID=1968902 RepID=UPI002B38A869|nr:hypothetical protein [Gordonibacter sp.]
MYAPEAADNHNVVIQSAKGTRRTCALPICEHFSDRLDDARSITRHHVYAEYVDACKVANERAYSFSSFCTILNGWRRQSIGESSPEWFPGEYMRTYWAMQEMKSLPRGSIRLFVAQMAFSDATFVCRAESGTPDSWMRCCERAFRWMGGVPHVTDCTMIGASMSNAGVSVHATLEAFAEYHKTVLFGARPKTAKTALKHAKPRDVRNSSYVLRQVRRALRECAPTSFEEVDVIIERQVAFLNATAFSDHPARSRVLAEREIIQMISLPKKPYGFDVWLERSVGTDHHFVYRGVRYSVPWRLAFETVRVQVTSDKVRAFFGGDLVASHAVKDASAPGRNVVTDPEHRPAAHRWYAARIDRAFFAEARVLGPDVVRAMRLLLRSCRRDGRGLADCKALLVLAQQSSVVSLDEACRKVLNASESFSLEIVKEAMGVVDS